MNMLFEADFLSRLLSFTLIVLSLYFARLLCGSNISNVPLWNGLGILALYACYCFSGLKFANGSSAGAELIVAALVATSVGSFVLGMRLAAARYTTVHNTRRKLQAASRHFIPPISSLYLWLLTVISTIFYLLLTHGQPWRLLTDGVGLKFERLQGIANKSPLLLNIDALVLAMTFIGLAWAILAYKDCRKSLISLGLSAFLMFIYVLSTGSRTPLIGVLLVILSAMSEARLRSRHMAWLSRKKWVILLFGVAGIAYMVVTTGSRIEFEALSDAVFYSYFNLVDFGLIDSLFKSGDSSSFFLATAVTYAASTFNNVVIRYQELATITITMGYKFLFYYISAVQIIFPGLLPQAVADWRDLAQINNYHLDMISQASGQWATPYGDLLWEFGIIGTFIIVALFGATAGMIIRKAKMNPSFNNLLLKVVVIGFSLSPLVNPFLSLYVHYSLVIVLFMYLSPHRWFSRNFLRRRCESLSHDQKSLT